MIFEYNQNAHDVVLYTVNENMVHIGKDRETYL